MKNIAIFLLALGLLALPVFAQEANTSADADTQTNLTAGADSNITINESQVGAVPGDFTYGFKRFFENVDKFFTFDKAESARKHAEYGVMRAMEAHVLSTRAQKLAAEGKEADANATLQQIEQLAQEQNQELEDAQTDIESAVDEGKANQTDVEEVQNITRNSIIVLQRVYEKAPEAAKEGLLRALNNSIQNYEKHTEKMEQKEMEKQERKNGTNETADDENETSDDSSGDNMTGSHGKGNKNYNGDGLGVNYTSEGGVNVSPGKKPEDVGKTETGDDSGTDSELNATVGAGNGGSHGDGGGDDSGSDGSGDD
jgi:hypothetical protein